MSPQEFKAEIQRKGWTYRALAGRWGIQESYISRLSRNPDRSRHWDDAVRGLPMVMLIKAKASAPARRKAADKNTGVAAPSNRRAKST